MKTSRKWTLGLMLLMLAGVVSAADFSSWQQKMPITFSGYTGSETLTNFPALVVLSTNITGFSYEDFLSQTNQDLRFTATNETTELNYEIEKWDTNGNSYVWVQVQNLVDTNTAVLAWWGKSGTNSPTYTTNGAAWDAGFRGVWHMKQTDVLDATANANNGTGSNGIATTSASIAGDALLLDGSDDYVDLGYGLQMGTNDATLSIWFNTGSISGGAGFIGKSSARGWHGRYMTFLASDQTRFGCNFDAGPPALGITAYTTWETSYNDSTWHQLTATYDRTGNATVYIDGKTKTATSISAYSATDMAGADPFYIGAYGNTTGTAPYDGFYFPGSLDEGRLMTVAASSNWVWATYMNMASNGVFTGSFNTYGTVIPVNPNLPQIDNVGLLSRTDSGAEVAGQLLTNGTSAATVYLYWSTTDGTTNASVWTSAGSVTNLGSMADGTTFTNTLTGLASNTTYYWNHSAANASGTVWSATAGSPSFRTFGPPEITNGSGVTEVDAVGATLNGDLTNGTAAHIFILQGQQDGVWSVTNDMGTLGEGAFSNAVIGLEPGTTNYYTCQATNAYGSVLATPSVSYTTLTSVVNTWIGGGTTPNASEAANWSGGVPVRGNTILLDSTTGQAMTWNAGSNGLPDTVFAWLQTESYTGTVTFATVYGVSGFTNFTVSGDATLNGGTWTHLANSSSEINRLCMTVGGSLLVSNATITANDLGFAARQGPGAGSGTGGAYGGACQGSFPSINEKVYGSITSPTNLGSGSGHMPGAGAIVLTVGGTTTVSSAGILTASSRDYTGGTSGSGGSVYLTTGWLTGNGTVRANAGYGANAWNGGGSGGRVAIVLTGAGADFTSWSGTNTAFGGPAPGLIGAAGTVYLQKQSGENTLIIDNNNSAAYCERYATLMTNSVNLNSFSNVVIQRKGILRVKDDTTLDFSTFFPLTYGPDNSMIAIDSDANVTYPTNWLIDGYTLYVDDITTNRLVNVTIGTNAVLSQYMNYTNEAYKLRLTLSGDLTVLSNGLITADYLGYKTGKGPGAGVGTVGGVYAGGATGNTGVTNFNTYGSILAPTHCGSGGGGGIGGGALLLTVGGTTTVASAAIVSANGASSGANGGGSGGSLYLTTGWLAGSGTIRANGGTGPGGNYSGGGSGGRVALVLTGTEADFASWTGTHTALGGPTYRPAAAGTVYMKPANIPNGMGVVTVSNGVSTALSTSVPSSADSTETLNVSSWIVSGYGSLNVRTNSQLGFLTVTGVVASVDLGGQQLSVMPQLNLNGTLYEIGTYPTNALAGGLVIDTVGGGYLEVRPAVDNAGGASNVTLSSASLNGNLYVADASSTALFALWGKQDAETNVASWAHTNRWPAPQTAGTFSTNLTALDLEANTVYYYRFYTTNSARQNIASTSSTFMTADVTVQSTGNASEAGLAPGTFTFYRHAAATNGPVTVNYSIGGSAIPGTNYVDDLGSSIAFAPGVSQVALTVTPIQDDTSLSNETVIVTLLDGSYPIGSPSVATGLVVNLAIPSAPTNTWLGGGNASQATNWSLGHSPTNMESVYLSGFSPANMVWDITNAVLRSWQQTGQYNGTVTFATTFGPSGNTNVTVNGDVTMMGGTWTHLANSSSEINRLCMTVGGNLLVSNATITANDLGFAKSNGPGAGSGTGGAYGGACQGSFPSINEKVYGSITSPTNLGSGSGHMPGAGAIVLTVGGTTTVSSAGILTANSRNYTGGTSGSGGSIFLTTGWLTGNGTVRANAGYGANPWNGGGSGGRVAVILTGAGADFTSWSGTNSAFGGPAPGLIGAAGTVYLQKQSGENTLIIDNNNSAAYCERYATLMTNSVNLNSFSNVVIRRNGILRLKDDTTLDFSTFSPLTYGPDNSMIAIDSDANVTYPTNWLIDGYTLYVDDITTNRLVNVTIGTNAVLSQYMNYTNEAYKLRLTLSGNLTVLSNGLITADYLGYKTGKGPGAGAGTVGGVYAGGATGNTGVVNFNTYGSILEPTHCGSGGGGGIGGGALLLTVGGTTTVESAAIVSANGASSGANGGGSGGSLYLTTGWLAGSGTIRANGGTGPGGNYSGGGSGGRVALVLTGAGADFTSWTGTHTALGGPTYRPAAAGTVYQQDSSTQAGSGLITIDNGNTALNATFTSLPAFSNSTEILTKTMWLAQNQGKIGLLTNTAVANLTVNNNAYLELTGNTLTVRTLAITNMAYAIGTYTADQLGALVSDGPGGGSVVVLGAFPGTVFIFR